MFTDAVSRTAKDIQRLIKVRAELEAKHETALVELAATRASLPETALAEALGEKLSAGPPPTLSGALSVKAKMMMLERDIEASAAALTALFPRLEAAMKALQVARSSEIRKKIAKLHSDLAAHREQSEKLLTALQNHESALYAPTPMMLVGELAGPALPMAMPNITRTAKLQQEIAKLEDKAIALERRAVNTGGGATASTLEELLRALDEADDTTIAPTRRAVENWYHDAFARADAEWTGFGRRHGDPEPPAAELSSLEEYRTLDVSLVWLANGIVDRENSSVRYSNRFQVPRELAAQTFGAVYSRTLTED
jgi:hypothetical protein